MNDVVTLGGNLSNFQQQDTLIYTAMFHSVVVSADMRSVEVPSHVFTGSQGEFNHESNVLQWNYDNSRPTITITAEEGVSGFASNNAALSVIFTLSENVTSFVEASITLNGVGITLSSFAKISGLTYNATLTADGEGLKSIFVDENAFQDKVSHGNLASNVFEFTYDVTRPTVTISAFEGDSGFASNDAVLSLTTIELIRLLKHTFHRCHTRHVPRRKVTIEILSTIKHGYHTHHTRRIPRRKVTIELFCE